MEAKEPKYMTVNDDEALLLIQKLKKSGAKIPKIDLNRNSLLTMVSYKNGFNLCLITYHCEEGDSGYTAFIIPNFLSENQFNFESLAQYGFNTTQVVWEINKQIEGILSQINYPFTIAMVFDKNFTGFMVTQTHLINEINNIDGYNN